MPRRDDNASPVDQLLVTQDRGESPESNFATNSQSTESLLESAAERSINHAVFGSKLGRREFVRLVGAGTAAAIVNSIFPMNAAKAFGSGKGRRHREEGVEDWLYPHHLRDADHHGGTDGFL